MPSPKQAASKETEAPKEKFIECEVLRGIGVEATKETLAAQKKRADTKGLKFDALGLTTMIYPNKKVVGSDGKTMVDGEPVFINLKTEDARKLSKAGAVRVVV